jgi:hypothetical protein
MQFIKEFIWLVVGIGLTLIVTSDTHTVRQVGVVLFLISVLWRLLIYLRDSQPSLQRINAIGEPKLSVIEALALEAPSQSLTAQPALPIASHQPRDLSPVQRLIDDDPSK